MITVDTIICSWQQGTVARPEAKIDELKACRGLKRGLKLGLKQSWTKSRRFFNAWSFRRGLAMLVLSRKESETIILTDQQTKREIVIKLVAINGNRVRIGIEADRQVEIKRSELVLRESA